MRYLDDVDNLTAEQRQLCRVLYDAFRKIVKWDVERSGLNPIATSASVGLYKSNKYDWHPDGGPHGQGAVGRWLMALGAGETIFAEGLANRHSTFTPRAMAVKKNAFQPKGPLRPVTYGLQVVTRFMAHIDIHSPPIIPEATPRILLNAISHTN